MINGYIIPAMSGVFGAISAISANIIYYKYRFNKEKKLEFLKMQLTELLLPLYIRFKNIESETYAYIDDKDTFLELLSKDAEIKKIAVDKLYLADSKLAHLLLEFLNNQYAIDSLMKIKDEDIIKNYEELKQVIFDEYNQKVEEYQRIFGIVFGSVAVV